MNFLKPISLITLSLLLFQCGTKNQSTSKIDCDTPPPQAIFNDKVAKIVKHSFKLNGRDAEENISFVDKSTLTIFQTGCDKILQEFRFQMDPQPEMDMPSLGVERLMYLANLDDAYMSFANWGQAIHGLRKEFASQSEVEVEQGFYVGLDKIDSKDRTIMIIKLFQK